MHRIIIIGGGVAGLDLATHLAGRPTALGQLDVTLVDLETAYVWKPMLHRIACGTSDVSEQETSFIAQARRCGFRFQLGMVGKIDRQAKQVHLQAWGPPGEGEVLPPRRLDYDTLILSFGSRANDFGVPGVAEHCMTIDSRGEAMRFNDRIRIAILKALARDAALKIAIVGGGATGVELAAELVQLAELSQSYSDRNMASKMQVSLLEMSGRLLGGFPDRVADAAMRRLQELGVKVHTGAHVTAVEAGGFRLKDGSLEAAELKVWAAGVKASEFQASLEGLELNRNRQIVVTPNLQATRDASIYALGDCSSLTPAKDERPLPPTAQVADQQARYLSARLPDLLAGRQVPDFVYRNFGMLVSLGDFDAYGSLGRVGIFRGGFIKGRVAQLVDAMLYRRHQVRVHGFWRGSLLWLTDLLNSRIGPKIKLD